MINENNKEPNELDELDFNKLIEKANQVYNDNFSKETWFGRCIFLSWFCDVGTCKFCFRSTTKHQIKYAKNAKRSIASIATDAIIGKNLGWEIEFLTGGYKIFSFEEMFDIIKLVSNIYKKKIWINLGILEEQQLEQIKPYVEGICASIETVNQKLHKDICPDKPFQPYLDMLEVAKKKGFETSMTIVIGLGETKDDINDLFDIIEKYKLDRITFYALKPVQGTPYTKSPEMQDYIWWVAQTRIRFPKLRIMAGLTPKKPEYAELLLKAGANAITKFPVVKKFNSEESKLIENMAKKAGREFKGSLTKLPKVGQNHWDSEVEKLDITNDLKQQIKAKLKDYIEKMKDKE